MIAIPMNTIRYSLRLSILFNLLNMVIPHGQNRIHNTAVHGCHTDKNHSSAFSVLADPAYDFLTSLIHTRKSVDRFAVGARMISYECYYIRPVLPAVEKNRGYIRAFDDGGGASIHVISSGRP
nr:MAG TPA: hypothetical protein [Caudoviricetes sp.]